jgi:hypothetical protein
MRLEIMTLPAAKEIESRTWVFTAAGAGFKPMDARTQAEERLIKQIETDTKMALHFENH